jgi:uncharacterized protein YndB with AHSA1/START domain
MYEAPKVTELVVTRHINASPQDVFDVWLDPQNPASIWEGAEELILEAVQGKLFYWRTNFDGKVWPVYGRFLVLDRGAGRIDHTWVGQGTQGLESTVSITLRAADGGTDLRLVHSGVPDDDFGRLAAYGWTMVADAIAGDLERSSTVA